MTDNRIRALVEYIGTALPPDRSHWPAGWPREAEAALLDAIFAARATYGTPTSGVRRVVANWRAHRKHELDDLGALAAFADAPDHLAEILDNRQRVPGNYTTKAEAAALAAAALIDAGITGSERIGDGRRARERSPRFRDWEAPRGRPSSCNSGSSAPQRSGQCTGSSRRRWAPPNHW